MVQVERVCGPGGMAQRTSYAINQPGQPTRHVTRTIVLRAAPGGRRPLDPNLPPTYEAAVTGRDRSVKVEDGRAIGPASPVPDGQIPQPHTLGQPQMPVPSAPPTAYPSAPPPAFSSAPPTAFPSAPPPAFPVHQPPPGAPSNVTSCLPPAYTPSPSAPVLNNDDDDDEIDANDRRRLLA